VCRFPKDKRKSGFRKRFSVFRTAGKTAIRKNLLLLCYCGQKVQITGAFGAPAGLFTKDVPGRK